MKSCYCVMFFALAGGAANAEIVAASSSGYELRHEASSPLAPAAMWDRLLQPEIWWHPDHTYSGDAANLSLDPQAGGLWREDWDGGSVAHGEVVMVQDGKQLRLNAPFGPLQGMGVEVVWTITLEPEEQTGGTRVTFTEVANGSNSSGLAQIAPAVDSVKSQAIARLTAAPAGTDPQED